MEEIYQELLDEKETENYLCATILCIGDSPFENRVGETYLRKDHKLLIQVNFN